MSAENVAYGVGAVTLIDNTNGKQYDLTHEASWKVMTDFSTNNLSDSSGSLTDARAGESVYTLEIVSMDLPPELCDRYLGATITPTVASPGLSFFELPQVLAGDGATLVGQLTTAESSLQPDVMLGTYYATRTTSSVVFTRVGADSVSGVVDVSKIFSGTVTLTGTGATTVVFHIVRGRKAGFSAQYDGNPARPRFSAVVTTSFPETTGLIETIYLPELVPEGGGFESERLSHREGTLTFKVIGGKFTRTTAPVTN